MLFRSNAFGLYLVLRTENILLETFAYLCEDFDLKVLQYKHMNKTGSAAIPAEPVLSFKQRVGQDLRANPS